MTRLEVDAEKKRMRVVWQAVLKLGGVLERVERDDAIVVVGGQQHGRRVGLAGVDVVKRRVFDEVVEAFWLVRAAVVCGKS